jgi:hypothetical protein
LESREAAKSPGVEAPIMMIFIVFMRRFRPGERGLPFQLDCVLF